MSIKSIFKAVVLSVTLVTAGGLALAADDPTIQQVYDAANAGRLDQAQSMMQQVLKDHPESGKAHYVEADLLAKQGSYSAAQAELDTAERLEPGLPKVKPQAVAELRQVIAAGERHTGSYSAPGRSSGFPLGAIVVVVLLIAFIVFAMRFMANRNQPPVYVQNGGTPGYGGGPAYGPGYGGGPGYGAPMGGGGIGSGIVGGLVTGAALGAGMVAGEELMHHFTDGNNSNQPPRDDYVPPRDDMGGNDFGVTDTSSWDDGGGGGGGDSGGDW